MFDNTNPYTLRTEIVEGITRYYVSFIDGQAIFFETEVSHSVYLEFLRFIKIERNLRRWDERHTDQSELTDEMLHRRALYPQTSVEEKTLDRFQNEQLRLAVLSLPEAQRRRFILHYEFDLTYEQIAKMEGCSKVAVKYTIDKAKDKITKALEIF